MAGQGQRLSGQHSLTTAARIFIVQVLLVHICGHVRQKGLMGNFHSGLAKGKTLSSLGAESRRNINTLEILTVTAGLEHSPCKGRLWVWFTGSRFGFTAPDWTPAECEVDHRSGDVLFTVISGGRRRDIGQNRRSFKI